MIDRSRTRILVVCCLAQCLAMLDVSIMNVALEPIRADLGFSATGLQWVVNAYTMAAAGFLLLGGRAADLFGRRRVFVGGLALFGLASLVGGLAPDQGILVAARAGQGLGGAVMAPTSLSILASAYAEGAERNCAFGLWGTFGGLGGASGALVGGVITDAASWRWTLLINAPVAIGLALASLRTMRSLARRRREASSFDLGGALSVTAGLVLITYGIVTSHRRGWDAAATLGPLGAGVGLVAVFGLIEARLAAAPLVPPRILRSRAVAGASVVGFCLGGAAFAMWFFVSLYLQRVLGLSPLQAGLAFAPISLTIVVFTQAASRLVVRLGPGRVLATGMTLLGAGMLLFSRIDADGSWAADVLVPSLVCASGIGCSFVCTTIIANSGVREQDSGLASGLVTTSFQIGGSIGLAVLATIAASHTAGIESAATLTAGFRRAFTVAGGLALAGAVITPVVRAGTAALNDASKNDQPDAAGVQQRGETREVPTRSGSASGLGCGSREGLLHPEAGVS
jgi:EmrB/QacA subfamily drug resistance transporter